MYYNQQQPQPSFQPYPQPQPNPTPRKDLGRFAATCFTYTWVMLAVIFFYTLVAVIVLAAQRGVTDRAAFEQMAAEFIAKDGTAYILAACLGVLVFTISRGKQLFTHDLRQKGQKMTPKVFFVMICFLLFAQLFTALVNQLMQSIMLLFNLDISEILSGGSGSQTLSMLLYSSLMAPITEEIIFRGAGLRALEKHGKIFAIILTSIIFGLFHENLFQLYFAALTGLGLAYIAFEYSIIWSIIFHIINNLVIAEGVDFISKRAPEPIVTFVYNSLLIAGSTVFLLVLILKWPKFRAYIQANRSLPGTYRQAFKSVWFWVLTVLTVLATLLPILLVYISSRF
ncbi:CPBP family intramembrane glutamic endopeptidase [Streptococcus panodentis]|uniref:CPBP family intramembrane metalloprotease domain-containing protein n=1 Tax=Streptococcus panodentis TaxID=1581472 RepID=A0ABS5AUB4_9STRE|nr:MULTISPECIES: CPBP family intramembrane glutamic endopeptidase [Streptococcus]KXT81129.1 putative protease [Streptococcus sp. DD11]MBP2619848.1 CPBP family intramembrane metalloprotease domain-containing protein [Streptococcus panodentis]